MKSKYRSYCKACYITTQMDLFVWNYVREQTEERDWGVRVMMVSNTSDANFSNRLVVVP